MNKRTHVCMNVFMNECISQECSSCSKLAGCSCQVPVSGGNGDPTTVPQLDAPHLSLFKELLRDRLVANLMFQFEGRGSDWTDGTGGSDEFFGYPAVATWYRMEESFSTMPLKMFWRCVSDYSNIWGKSDKHFWSISTKCRWTETRRGLWGKQLAWWQSKTTFQMVCNLTKWDSERTESEYESNEHVQDRHSRFGHFHWKKLYFHFFSAKSYEQNRLQHRPYRGLWMESCSKVYHAPCKPTKLSRLRIILHI